MTDAPWDRHRGGTLFKERRTNAWAALVGFYLGQGRLAPQIASILHDGTTAETIRTMTAKWGLPRGKNRSMPVPVYLEAKLRLKLWHEANRKGCKPEELLRRIAVAIIEDDLFDAVIDSEKPANAPDSL